MSLIIWLVVGAIAGMIAQYALRDKWSGGMTGNFALAITGAVVAGWLMLTFGNSGGSVFGIWNLMAPILGAGALLWAGRAFTSTPILR